METATAEQRPIGLSEGTWIVDRPHSQVGFMAVDRADLKFIAGRFTDFEGKVVVDAEGTTTASGTINVASVVTDEADRDDHLRSGDFFEADSHPVFEFKSALSWPSDGTVAIDGELRSKGHAERLALHGEVVGVARDSKDNERLALAASGELQWGTIEVRLSLAISAIRQQ